ncbi:MAG TPA: prenyltransferase/squalene oxidase repeat-containing protein, partial [Planctomycetota bacterium]|nr:prenyltransferase/squalene oxidase repeat-containing protein [Planctomycetota bacterium]
GTGSAEGTNPTAAALGILSTLDALDATTARRARTFLVSMQRADGGFAATPGAPVSDLMSSFTALAALGDTGSLEDVRLGDLGRYVKGLALEPGGFRGSPADEATDVEYTYYGLGVLALLAEAAASRRNCRPGDQCRT